MEENAQRILIVDDEPDILELVSYNLEQEGFKVYTATDGYKGMALAKSVKPALIILDIMMPGIDGVEVCRQLREIPDFAQTLIVFLTARSEDYSEIAGFNVGADDYVTKPIRLRVLITRLKTLIRRHYGKSQEEKIFELGPLKIDPNKRIVEISGETIFLPKKEFELLSLLVSKPGKIFSRDEIYLKVWGSTVQVGDRTLDVYIRKLRKKIGEAYIKTSKGIGYGIDARALSTA